MASMTESAAVPRTRKARGISTRLAIMDMGVISPKRYQVSSADPAQAAMDTAISPVMLLLMEWKIR